MTEQIFWRCI